MYFHPFRPRAIPARTHEHCGCLVRVEVECDCPDARWPVPMHLRRKNGRRRATGQGSGRGWFEPLLPDSDRGPDGSRSLSHRWGVDEEYVCGVGYRALKWLATVD